MTEETDSVSLQEHSGVPICPQKPWMTDEETECFRKWIPKSGVVLEFGMGGSTRLFCETGIARLDSVESDPAWVAAMAGDPFLAFFIRKNRLFLHHADIGPVREHGLPISQPHPGWLRYHQQVWESINADALDMVLIDGRFRLACACQVLLRCPQRPLLLIHDFSCRPHYHAILAFTDVKDSVGTTVVLRQKPDINIRKLALVLQYAQFDAL